MKRMFLIIIFLTFLNVSCKKDTSPIPSIPEGTFDFRGLDTTGIQIYSGWLTVNFTDSINLTGKWRFTQRINPQKAKYEVLEGYVTGSVEEKRTVISLKTDIHHYSINLVGFIENNIIEGEWYRKDYLFWGDSGPFKAIKK